MASSRKRNARAPIARPAAQQTAQPAARSTKEATPSQAEAHEGPRVPKAEFTAGAAAKKQIPVAHAPEIAFAGRSNVGKSSLLNMMLARKGLARTSRTPGCTRQINFFDVAVAGAGATADELTFVDLPGYGYAKVSKAEARDWKELLESYLSERPTLRAVVILVDVRRGLEQEESDLVAFLEHRRDIPVIVAATKLDKLPRASHKPRLAAIARESGVRVVGTSASSSLGRGELWKRIFAAVRADDAAITEERRNA